MRKFLNFLILLLFLSSCVKEIELSFKSTEPQIVVNCLFSEDEPWKLYLTKMKYEYELYDQFIDNAVVRVESNNNDTILFVNEGNGIYTSSKYPKDGQVYSLSVYVPGYNTITATSKIPGDIEVSDINYSSQEISYFFSNTLEDFDVSPLSLKLTGKAKCHIRFRFYTFNTKKGYLRYKLSHDDIILLKKKGVPEDCLIKLEELVGYTYTSTDFINRIRLIQDECNYFALEINVDEVVQKFTIDLRERPAFDIDAIFSESSWTRNISTDFRTLIGEFQNDEEANLLVSRMTSKSNNNDTSYKIEYWLEVTSMNEDFYKYQESYILHAFQIANPYSDPVQVYSNINNGVGIFAGFNRQMIHFYDY